MRLPPSLSLFLSCSLDPLVLFSLSLSLDTASGCSLFHPLSLSLSLSLPCVGLLLTVLIGKFAQLMLLCDDVIDGSVLKQMSGMKHNCAEMAKETQVREI
jgi:hypothetical protein